MKDWSTCSLPGPRYEGEVGKGIAWNMERAHNQVEWMEAELEQEAAVSVYKKWDEFDDLSVDLAMRDAFDLLDNETHPVARAAIAAATQLSNLCFDVQTAISDEFKRDEIIERLLGIEPLTESRSRHSKAFFPVSIGEYDREKSVFTGTGNVPRMELTTEYFENAKSVGQDIQIEFATNSLGSCSPQAPYELAKIMGGTDIKGNPGFPTWIIVRYVVRNAANLLLGDLPVESEAAQKIVEKYSYSGVHTFEALRPFAVVLNFAPLGSATFQPRSGLGVFLIEIPVEVKNVSYYPYSQMGVRMLPEAQLRVKSNVAEFLENEVYPKTHIPKIRPIWSKDLN